MPVMVPRKKTTAREVIAGMMALIPFLLFIQPGFAGGGEHRAIQLLLEKKIISQRKCAQEDEVGKTVEARHLKEAIAITKGGLQMKLGGLAELDWGGSASSCEGIIASGRPVLRSDTLGGADRRYQARPRHRSGAPTCCTTRFHGVMEFLVDEQRLARPQYTF